MTAIRINAISVPESGGEELARRFAERAGAVDNADGFEGLGWLPSSRARFPGEHPTMVLTPQVEDCCNSLAP